MNPEDSHVYVYDVIGDGKYDLVAEYDGFPLQPLNMVVHNPPIRHTTLDLYSHLGKK